MVDLKGQTAVVFGLANKRSIAWAIAQKLSAAGISFRDMASALQMSYESVEQIHAVLNNAV